METGGSASLEVLDHPPGTDLGPVWLLGSKTLDAQSRILDDDVCLVDPKF